MTCDVVVIGGGPAGIAAAAAAGRLGAQVLLLERYGFLGGLASVGLVSGVCGLFLRESETLRPVPVAAGFPAEFSERLAKASGSQPQRLNHGLWVLPCRPWAFERVADAVVNETASITPILHALATRVRVEGPRLIEVRAVAWHEEVSIRPQCVVDCSGEATVAALVSRDVTDGACDQSPALVFAMESVDPDFSEQGVLVLLRELRRAVNDGRLPPGCQGVAPVPGTNGRGRLTLKLNLGLPAGSGDGAWRRMTAWEREGRALVDQIQTFLIEHLAPFRHAHLSHAAFQVGTRTGRRIRGKATLNEADVLDCRKSPDGIARGCWPIEVWSDRAQPELAFFEEGGYYEIPLGCLQPRGLDNVFTAGRCISATARAQASARVIGTVLAMGWAAGTAAALQAARSPLSEVIAAIRNHLYP